MPNTTQLNTKNIEISRSVSVVLADANGQPNAVQAAANGTAPAEFELLKVGMWRTPWHGDIMIMPDDLTEYVDNYKAGLAVAGAGKLKLPINYGHESWEKAAGWFVPEVRGETLWATEVEWTPAGEQAIKDGEWKCISAEFCPKGRGGWIDPLDQEHIVENVLEGAALTNIPLFRNLEPVMASATFGRDTIKPNVFLITASEQKEPNMPTLQEVLAKENDALTDDERAILVENKDTLSAEDRAKFGFEASAPTEKTQEPTVQTPNVEEPKVTEQVSPEVAEIAASIKKGEMVAIKASEWKDTQDKLTELRRKDVEADVKAHAARGAIKADQIGTWTDKVLADASMKDILANLPSNEVLASTIGSDANAGDATDPIIELQNKAKELVVASADKGQALSFAQAQDQIMRENKDLKDRVEASRAPKR